MHYESISITKPLLPKFEELEEEIKEILSTGQITNGKYVSIIESLVAEYIGVKQVVAVSSCTLGLILALQSAGLKGKIIIPSFTFSATEAMAPPCYDCAARLAGGCDLWVRPVSLFTTAAGCTFRLRG